jgi:hypothetical protein
VLLFDSKVVHVTFLSEVYHQATLKKGQTSQPLLWEKENPIQTLPKHPENAAWSTELHRPGF